MIVYNVTVKVEEEIASKWLAWMKEVHIPDVLATGYFTNARISRLLGLSQEDGPTFSIQYTCESTKKLHEYQVKAAPALQQDHINKFGEKALAYRTMMEVIQEF